MFARTSKSEERHSRHHQSRHPDSSADRLTESEHGANPTALFRKTSCACGGGCPTCQSNSGLKISSPNDSAELEADRIADTVMRKSHDDSHAAEQSLVHVDQASIFPKREFSTPGIAAGSDSIRDDTGAEKYITGRSPRGGAG